MQEANPRLWLRSLRAWEKGNWRELDSAYPQRGLVAADLAATGLVPSEV